MDERGSVIASARGVSGPRGGDLDERPAELLAAAGVAEAAANFLGRKR